MKKKLSDATYNQKFHAQSTLSFISQKKQGIKTLSGQ